MPRYEVRSHFRIIDTVNYDNVFTNLSENEATEIAAKLNNAFLLGQNSPKIEPSLSRAIEALPLESADDDIPF